MRQFRSLGSARGAASNGGPYRDPGRSQHDALDALSVGLATRVNWVLDADVRGFFDHLDREWLAKFLRHRTADERVLRLVIKWLNAGVLEDGQWSDSGEGTPQGGSITPPTQWAISVLR